MKRNENKFSKRSALAPGAAVSVGNKNAPSLPKLGSYVDADTITNHLGNCDNKITPHCLRALYGIPKGKYAEKKNSYGKYSQPHNLSKPKKLANYA